MARGVSTENRTEEGVIRSDDHFHASSFLRSLDPLLTSFRYTREELTIAAVAVTAGLQTSRASIFQLPAALTVVAVGFWQGKVMRFASFVAKASRLSGVGPIPVGA